MGSRDSLLDSGSTLVGQTTYKEEPLATNLSVRLSDDDEKRLDRLVIAWRAYYVEQAKKLPIASHLPDQVGRSSALRDLLLAWDHGFVPENVAKEPIND